MQANLFSMKYLWNLFSLQLSRICHLSKALIYRGLVSRSYLLKLLSKVNKHMPVKPNHNTLHRQQNRPSEFLPGKKSRSLH